MELQEQEKLLDAWFKAHYDEILEKIETVVNMDSFSHDGQDVNKLGEKICSFFDGTGFTAEQMPKKECPKDEPWQEELGNVCIARTHKKEAGAGIVFLAHMDTVFPKGTTKDRPFRLDRENDRAYGPGVADMKAGLIANVFAAVALKENNLLSCPVTLVFSADEELGSPASSRAFPDNIRNILS